MENSHELSDEKFWQKKIKEHWKIFIVVIIAAACLFTGMLLVLFWFMQTSPIGGFGLWTFNQWTLMHIVCFILLLILWELLFVGIPAALFFGVGGYIWWKRLPDEEKQEFKARDKKKTHRARNAGGGGGFSFFIFIAYCIYMAVQGYYDAQFGSQPYSFWIYSWFLTIMWIVIVLGIPALIILIIVYFTVWRKKSK
ncbi:MAG: hypothetical protein ACFFDF_01710 [Candidatus Odinarchaeota archaeon]